MTDHAPSELELSGFDHYLDRARARRSVDTDPYVGTAGGAACGDLVSISLRPHDGRIAVAGFDASGCAAALAAASAVAELVDGTDILDAMRISADDVSCALGGLSPGKVHAAALCSEALAGALGRCASAGALALAPSDGRTLVAMSGGVDSAVAAWLVREAGHEAVGVTLKLWSDPDNDAAKSCCSSYAASGAGALARGMGLAHVALDMRSEFRSQVVNDFIRGHAQGKTPNPCVRCNGLVRFDGMLALASKLGAAQLATGHYARIARDGRGPLVRKAADSSKDQSYVLARLDPAILHRLSFPLGELTKPEVRRIAEAAELPVASKPESQDLCFLAGTKRSRFLQTHGPPSLSESERTGEIVDSQGTVLGTHRGHEHFTVGQRRGIGVAAHRPLYVLAKNAASNRVVVGSRQELEQSQVVLEQARLYRAGSLVDGVKLRYRQRPAACTVEPAQAGDHNTLELDLHEPVAGVAPGQVACLLSGDRVVGYGTIA